VHKTVALKAECISFARREANGSISEDSRFGNSIKTLLLGFVPHLNSHIRCHPEQSEESRCWLAPAQLQATTEIPRFARDDMEWR